jgi:di/tricarboxylate transporter
LIVAAAAAAMATAAAAAAAVCRNLLAIFAGTIVGIITTPLPLGAVAMLGLGVSMLTKTLSFAEAFSAFANEIP